MKVFVSGADTVKRLNDFSMDVIDSLIANGDEIIVSDSRGADSLVQSYLASSNYRNVTVITSDVYPHINAAGWKYLRLNTSEEACRMTNHAYMIWDGKDKKIFDIIFSMLSLKKPVRIFLTHLGRLEKIDSKRDLNCVMMGA